MIYQLIKNMTRSLSPIDEARNIGFIALLDWLVKHDKMDKYTAHDIYKKQHSLEFEAETKYIWNSDE